MMIPVVTLVSHPWSFGRCAFPQGSGPLAQGFSFGFMSLVWVTSVGKSVFSEGGFYSCCNYLLEAALPWGSKTCYCGHLGADHEMEQLSPSILKSGACRKCECKEMLNELRHADSGYKVVLERERGVAA